MQNLKQHFALVDQLKNSFQPPLTTPVIAVVGPFNSGKSTLINNLLGQQLSPIGVVPTTSTCIWFSYGQKLTIQVYDDKQQVKTISKFELSQLLTPKKYQQANIQKIAIKLTHPLLQKISIIDTPGVDAGGVTTAQNLSMIEQIKPVQHVAYLFHQRGVSDTDRQIIQTIIQAKGLNSLSFWINRNLGAWDGSSLLTARQLLREICSGQVDVFTINTNNVDDVEKFNLFVQDQAAKDLLKQARSTLKELDRQIPALINKALQKTNDIAFLIDYGQAYTVARQILHSHRLMLALPPVTPKIKLLLTAQSTKTETVKPTPLIYKTTDTTPDPTAVKDKIQALLKAVLQSNVLSHYPDPLTRWQKITHQLNQEQYLVVAVGGFSSGKTTFINAMLGEPLLPAENRPTTFAVTHLKAGSTKNAVINYAREVLIPTYRLENKQALVCRHELAALEFWLTNNDLRGQIIKLTKNKGGRYYQITAQQLLNELAQLKTTLAKNTPRPLTGQNYWPTIFKKLSLRQFNQTSPAHFYKVYFTGQKQQTLDLSTPAGVNALTKLAGSPLALPVATIEVQHPAPILRLATLVDTPGLDAVYQKHDAITRQYLPQSDCLLLFFNGKHILTKPDRGLWQHILNNADPNHHLNQKLFIVVNFADTLTGAEQEKVRSYLTRHIIKPSADQVPMERIYFISSLQALSGQCSGEFSRLKRHLKNHIWYSRCQQNYRQYLNECENILRSLPATPHMESASIEHQILPHLNTIAQLKQTISPTGGIKSGKRPHVR